MILTNFEKSFHLVLLVVSSVDIATASINVRPHASSSQDQLRSILHMYLHVHIIYTAARISQMLKLVEPESSLYT